MSSNINLEPGKGRAVLFAVQTASISDHEATSSLAELKRLVTTLGLEVIAQVEQKRPTPAPATLLGEGKLKILASYTGGKGAIENYQKHTSSLANGNEEEIEPQVESSDDFDEDESTESVNPKDLATVAIFDGEITPTQLRNLEQALGVEVLDRTGVILEIFSRHASTREAKLQVEIAKLAYAAPRLRASSIGGDRQGGGIGGKGSGETSHELDKRRIRDRIAELRQQLSTIKKEDDTRRQRRKDNLQVSLVGYTNAGKSSLMRALTGTEVLVADKLFATLDTRVRPLHPRSFPPVLVSDTVGFIKKLPHDLVASFRSTLDEAHAASLLLFVVDASDPDFRSQLKVTQDVLSEIGAETIPKLLVLNKKDKLSDFQLALLQKEYPEAVLLSSKDQQDIQAFKQRLLTFFEETLVEATLKIPYLKGHLLGQLREKARIKSETYLELETEVNFLSYPSTIAWLKQELS